MGEVWGLEAVIGEGDIKLWDGVLRGASLGFEAGLCMNPALHVKGMGMELFPSKPRQNLN